MEIEKLDVNKLMLISISGDELAAAKKNMIDAISSWALTFFPKIGPETMERNLATFVELKKYDDACKSCMGIQMCPSNGCKMGGTMMPDGVVDIWMETCPSGYKPDKQKDDRPAEERPASKKWTPKR